MAYSIVSHMVRLVQLWTQHCLPTIRRIGMTSLGCRAVRGVGFEDYWDNLRYR